MVLAQVAEPMAMGLQVLGPIPQRACLFSPPFPSFLTPILANDCSAEREPLIAEGSQLLF